MSANSVMTYKGYRARVYFDTADEIFVGHLAGIDDVIAFDAVTEVGLKTALQETVDDDVTTCERAGTPAKNHVSLSRHNVRVTRPRDPGARNTL